MPKPKPTPAVCEWECNEFYDDYWRASCGKTTPLPAARVILPFAEFCPYCGKKLTVKA